MKSLALVWLDYLTFRRLNEQLLPAWLTRYAILIFLFQQSLCRQSPYRLTSLASKAPSVDGSCLGKPLYTCFLRTRAGHISSFPLSLLDKQSKLHQIVHQAGVQFAWRDEASVSNQVPSYKVKYGSTPNRVPWFLASKAFYLSNWRGIRLGLWVTLPCL